MRRWLAGAAALLVTLAGAGGTGYAAVSPGTKAAPAPLTHHALASKVLHKSLPQQVVRVGKKSSATSAPRGRAPRPLLTTPRVVTAQINVTYIGFDAQARLAFQAAVNIWATKIHSSVPINITADWSDLSPYGPGVLGAAGPGDFVANFTNAPNQNVFYPVALANAIAGSDQLLPTACDTSGNVGGAEILASFNSAFLSWYKGTDGAAGNNQVDLESVVLHELGHGLGFVGTFEGLDPATGNDVGKGYFGGSGDGQNSTIFDTFVADGTGQPLIGNYTNNTTALGNVLRGSGGGVRWDGANAMAANGGIQPILYAPSPWEEGSSFSHLDENTYPQGNANALMSPVVNFGEVITDPGPIVLGMFKDLGWSTSPAALDSSGGQYHPVWPIPLPRLAVPQGSSDALARQVTGKFGVPSDATAVVVNVEIKAPKAKGYYAVLPGCAFAGGMADTGDYTAGQSRIAQATLPVDPAGRIRISPSAGSPAVNVDLVGWYGPGATGATYYHHLQNQQVAALKKVSSSAPLDVTVAGLAGIPATGATAVVFKARISAATVPAAIVISPGGVAAASPTQWFAAREMLSSFITVPLGTGTAPGQVRMRLTAGTATVSLEAVGWYGVAPTGGLFFHEAGPSRYPLALRGQEVTVGGLPANSQVEVVVHLSNPTASGWLGSAPAGHPTLHGIQEYFAGKPVSGTIIATTNTTGQLRLHLSAGISTMYVDFQGWFATT